MGASSPPQGSGGCQCHCSRGLSTAGCCYGGNGSLQDSSATCNELLASFLCFSDCHPRRHIPFQTLGLWLSPGTCTFVPSPSSTLGTRRDDTPSWEVSLLSPRLDLLGHVYSFSCSTHPHILMRTLILKFIDLSEKMGERE